jgi:hypothetical protein
MADREAAKIRRDRTTMVDGKPGKSAPVYGYVAAGPRFGRNRSAQRIAERDYEGR